MPKFNRERAKAELGWTDGQIDAYLRTDQARQDSAAVTTVQPPTAGGSDPLGMIGGMGASALDAVGGPTTLIAAGGLGGSAFGVKKLIDYARRGMAPAPPVAPPVPAPAPSRVPATPKPSASLAYVTEADIKALPQLKNYSPGEEIRRATLERYKETTAAPAAPARTTAKIVPLPKKRTKRPPAKPPERTVPIKVQDRPAAVRGEQQRGVSKREIASRQQGMAESRISAAEPDDMMAQLEKQLAYEQAATSKGIGVGGGARKMMRSGLRGMGAKALGPLGWLLTLNDVRTMPQQIREAGVEGRRIMRDQLRQEHPLLADQLDQMEAESQRVY